MNKGREKGNHELKRLNESIEHFACLLNAGYAQRRGRMMWNEDGTWSEAWCAVCGKAQVNPDAGEDTCHECLHSI